MPMIRPLCPSSILLAVLLLVLAIPPLRAADAAKKDAPTDTKVAGDAKLPTAQEVIARFVKAIGGRDAMLKHASQHVKGTLEMPAQGIKGPVEVFAAKPDKMVIKVQIPGFGDVLSGYDGKVGWSVNAATGPMLLDGKQLEQLKEQAEYAAALHDEKNYKSMAVEALTEFEGKPCYKLKLVRTSGNESTEYFDAKTGFLVGMIAEQESPMGRMSVTSTLSDYKDFGGALYATKTVQSIGPFQQVINIASVDFGKVPATAFDLPEAIKALTNPSGSEEKEAAK